MAVELLFGNTGIIFIIIYIICVQHDGSKDK